VVGISVVGIRVVGPVRPDGERRTGVPSAAVRTVTSGVEGASAIA
jgi:hypothetical protein